MKEQIQETLDFMREQTKYKERISEITEFFKAKEAYVASEGGRAVTQVGDYTFDILLAENEQEIKVEVIATNKQMTMYCDTVQETYELIEGVRESTKEDNVNTVSVDSTIHGIKFIFTEEKQVLIQEEINGEWVPTDSAEIKEYIMDWEQVELLKKFLTYNNEED